MNASYMPERTATTAPTTRITARMIRFLRVFNLGRSWMNSQRIAIAPTIIPQRLPYSSAIPMFRHAYTHFQGPFL